MAGPVLRSRPTRVTAWRPLAGVAPREGPLHEAAAPAKINLTLAVIGGPRSDGYHRLRGVSARLSLVDDLSVRTTGSAPTRSGDMLRMRPGSAGVRTGDDLALQAAEALRAWAARPLPRLALALRKRIPVGAGLGGGSSDAATALRLAARAWGLAIGEDELATIALGLGSDVPFFLAASPIALVSGRGEEVEPLPAAGVAGTGVLLVCRDGKPSTAEVFAAYDAQRRRSHRERTPAGGAARGDAQGARGEGGGASQAGALDLTDRLVVFLRKDPSPAGLVDLAPLLRDANDLYPAAARVIAGLPGLRERVEQVLGRPGLFSGAGPTFFVLYPSPAEAREALRALRAGLGVVRASGRPPRLIATAIASH